jgi:succinate dehydrogenase / fumarate reductase cytochrome b subunit
MRERPLSPHLQVYRLPITAMLSISHRATGVFLSLGAIFWVAYLMAAAQGDDSFATVQSLLNSIPGRLGLWVWVYSLMFHLCHGIRHLVWDTVHGLDREVLERHAYLELAASVALTGILAAVAIRFG